MTTPLEVATEIVGQLPVVTVTGEIDITSAPTLRDELERLITPTSPTVVVDLTDTTFFDSTGIATLVRAHKLCHEAGGRLRVVDPNATTLRIFRATGLVGVFSIFATLDEALAG
jgi:anti-sigma B factor antagonist